MDTHYKQSIDSELEQARVDALNRYEILNTPLDPAFDRITFFAAKLLNVPVACINLVDQDKIWSKSHYGTDVKEYDRATGICSTVILGNEPYIVLDAAIDPRASEHAIFDASSGVRFYAGIPLNVEGKYNLGTLCILDFKPRTLSKSELEILSLLSSIVVDELELHHSLIKIAELNENLEKSELHFRRMFDQAGVGVSMADSTTGAFIDTNHRYCEIVGYSLDELRNINLLSITYPDDVPLQKEMTAALNSGKVSEYYIQKRYIRKDKSIVWVNLTCTALWKSGETPSQHIAVVQDITDKKLAELVIQESEERWKFALEGSDQGVWDLDVNTNQIYLSPRCKEMLGYPEDQISSDMAEWVNLIHPDDLPCLISARQVALEGVTKTFENEHRKLANDGSWKWIQVKGMVVHRDEKNAPLRVIGTYTDITEKKNNAAEIIRLAHFDGITNLPNRILFMDRLEQELKKSNRNGKPIALMMLDLDRFKEINDTLGHHKGDALIKLVSERLLDCVRETDTVGRLGGDEFTIILTDLEDPIDVEQVANKILEKVAVPYQLDGELAYITASIGITLYPSDSLDIEVLLKNADQAMYAAKESGRNRFSYFTPLMQEKANEKVYLTNSLRSALARSEFRVLYQPIYDLNSNRMHKAEALIRWQHPEKGLISPALFIPIAEETGQIVEIGEWVFKQSAEAVKICRDKIHPNFQISVNKSPVQFRADAKPHTSWFAHLEQMGLGGDSIVIEITEGLLLDQNENLSEQFKAFQEAGIQVALDDFGTGYSSLSYLLQFDIDYIKIDQSFVRNLNQHSENFVLCEAIIAMAHKLKMLVIAEGVETLEQLEILKASGCDFAQGYYFSRPIPLEQLLALATSNKLSNY